MVITGPAEVKLALNWEAATLYTSTAYSFPAELSLQVESPHWDYSHAQFCWMVIHCTKFNPVSQTCRKQVLSSMPHISVSAESVWQGAWQPSERHVLQCMLRDRQLQLLHVNHSVLWVPLMCSFCRESVCVCVYWCDRDGADWRFVCVCLCV